MLEAATASLMCLYSKYGFKKAFPKLKKDKNMLVRKTKQEIRGLFMMRGNYAWAHCVIFDLLKRNMLIENVNETFDIIVKVWMAEQHRNDLDIKQLAEAMQKMTPEEMYYAVHRAFGLKDEVRHTQHQRIMQKAQSTMSRSLQDHVHQFGSMYNKKFVPNLKIRIPAAGTDRTGKDEETLTSLLGKMQLN